MYIKVATNQKSFPYWQIIFTAGILFAVICQLIATSCGLGMTNDSYMFLEGVSFFSDSNDLTMQDFAVFQAKPPLFSLFLAILPLAYIHLIYALILTISLFLWAKIIDQLISDKLWKSIAFLTIASFTPFLMVHVYLWTEPFFMLFLVISILVFLKLEQNVNTTYFAVFVIMSFLLILTRHVGVYFVSGFSLALFYNKRVKNKYFLTYLGLGILVFVIWNFVLMQSGIESRLITLKSPVSGGSWGRLDNISFYLDAASKWVLPNSLPYWLRLGVLITCIIGLVSGFWKQRSSRNFATIVSLVIISATYYVLMHIAFRIDPHSAERYLMPIFPISVVIVFLVLEKITESYQQYRKTLIIFAIIWLLYPVYRSAKNAQFWHDKLCIENEIPAQIIK